MNVKGNNRKNQVKDDKNNVIKLISKEEMIKKTESISEGLTAWTWHDLETRGKFSKNEKLSFISDDMLIVGCDIGSQTHYVRAIDTRGHELSKGAYSFNNSKEGFESAKEWALKLAAANDKRQIVMGLEPTGHYWFCIAAWMIANGVSVVQVNPYAVKQTKELEDNSQNKDDCKDPKLIANLVKDGNYGMPYLPEDIYADLRGLSTLREQLVEDRIRQTNRLHRQLKIYFPEYVDAFGKIDGTFTTTLLREAPFPEDIVKIGAEGVRAIWREAKLRGRGYNRADKIVTYAKSSVGLRNGTDAARMTVQWNVREIIEISARLEIVEEKLHEKCHDIPQAENILEIKGVGENILAGIIAEMGDISRFDDVKEIQKLSGMGLVSCSSGKHTGQTKISHRGRKRLRYYLFQAARSAVAHAEEFKTLHLYYTTRPDNPQKKMQSLIIIACKILRVIYTLLKTGQRYDPERMLQDIRRPEKRTLDAAA